MEDVFKIITESRFEKAQGSKLGRAKGRSRKGKTTAEKSKVKIYPTILDALSNGFVGQVFSTKGSRRLYVITKHKWGKDKDQRVGDKIAKGFTPGSAKPGASFKDVKGFATRTLARHGGHKAKNLRSKEFFKSGFRGPK